MNMTTDESAVTVREQIELMRRVLVKRWWVIALIAIVSGISAFATARLLSPVYEATTTVRILKEPSAIHAVSRTTYGRTGTLQAEAMWFTSRQVLEPVVRRLALAQSEPSSIIDKGLEKAKGMMRKLLGRPVKDNQRFYDIIEKLQKKSVNVKELEGSNVLEIKVTWNDPEMTMRIANTLVDVFIEQFQTFNRGRARQNRVYLDEQVRLTRKRLADSEQALVDFQKTSGLVIPKNMEMPSDVLLQELTLKKRQAELSLAQAKAERDELDRRLAESIIGDDSSGDEDGVNESLRAALTNPNSLLRTLMARVVLTEDGMTPADGSFKKKHPAISKMNAELDSVRAKLKAELARLGASVDLSPDDLLVKLDEEQRRISAIQRQTVLAEHEQLQLRIDRSNCDMRIRTYEDQLSKLKVELDDAKQKTMAFPEELRKYMALEREKRVNEELYTMLNTRLAGAQLDENTDLYDVRVFDPAQVPVKPLKPKPVLMTIIGLFMGGLLGISVAFIFEYMDDSLRTAEEVESFLDLPVLAELPKVKLKKITVSRKETSKVA
ncbi:MAG: GumC family protein [Candidatus Hydrogenedentes bacterium]|nr:GumC family protein [Candidatus Hydrogenedentota bacterium]